MYCVIVGDIIHSTKIDPGIRKMVTTALQDTFDRINTDHIGSLMATFGMVRGDAFVGIVLSQCHAPNIVQDIIKAAYNVERTKMRVSVALGQLTIISDDRNIVDGPALHTAFSNLEKLKQRKSDHWLQVVFDMGSLSQPLIDGHFALMTALTKDWTDKQHEVVWAMEKYSGRQNVVGKMLSIPPSVVSKQLKAANYKAYRKAWEGLTDYLMTMDEYVVGDKPIIEKSYVPYYNAGLREGDNQKKFTTALSYFQKALEMAKNKLDKDDPMLIPIYNKLARTSLHAEQYEDAGTFIDEAMNLHEKIPKERLLHNEIPAIAYATTLHNIALYHYKTQNHEQVSSYAEEALTLYKDKLPSTHEYIEDVLLLLSYLKK